MVWSISKDKEILIASDDKGVLSGSMASSFEGHLAFDTKCSIPPGLVIKYPPKNAVEEFLAAYDFLAKSPGVLPLEYVAPPDLDDYLGEPVQHRVF